MNEEVLVFEHGDRLRAGQPAPLTLRSHPGQALVRAAVYHSHLTTNILEGAYYWTADRNEKFNPFQQLMRTAAVEQEGQLLVLRPKAMENCNQEQLGHRHHSSRCATSREVPTGEAAKVGHHAGNIARTSTTTCQTNGVAIVVDTECIPKQP